MKNSHITIRSIEMNDAPYVLSWENDMENWAVSDNDSSYSMFDIVNLIHQLQDVKKAKQGRWIICKEEVPIGAVDLTEIDFDKYEASVGILVANEKDRRSGFAVHGLNFIEVEASKLGLKRLKALIHVDNFASLKLFEKCDYIKIGFSDDKYFKDGEYIDTVIYEKCLKE